MDAGHGAPPMDLRGDQDSVVERKLRELVEKRGMGCAQRLATPLHRDCWLRAHGADHDARWLGGFVFEFHAEFIGTDPPDWRIVPHVSK